MADSALIAFAVGGVLGIAATLLVLAARRLLRGARDLGTVSERATYRALHEASMAAGQLRNELTASGTGKAVRHLRALLEASAVAIVNQTEVLAMDGGADAERAAAGRAAALVLAHKKAQVVRGSAGAFDAVASPIRTGDNIVAVLVAFDRPARAGLVRATAEVAEWMAGQLQLGELASSRAALAEAQVRALRAQISPHFIYNALGAIASFITTDPSKARDLVLEFADFTRYSFRRDGDTTTLAEELRSIDSYLKLERARFGDRLKVKLQIAPEVLPIEIPFLSVQPLVENAVRHGLEAKEHGGVVSIRAHDAGPHVEIDVDDDGVGMDPRDMQAAFAGEPSAEHVGLRNVDLRLRRRYGQEFGLIVETNRGAGTLVRIRIPKKGGA